MIVLGLPVLEPTKYWLLLTEFENVLDGAVDIRQQELTINLTITDLILIKMSAMYI